eukprot:scaffold7887_cov286-Pinguiococcus_pyrenoidosus.AAC.2
MGQYFCHLLVLGTFAGRGTSTTGSPVATEIRSPILLVVQDAEARTCLGLGHAQENLFDEVEASASQCLAHLRSSAALLMQQHEEEHEEEVVVVEEHVVVCVLHLRVGGGEQKGATSNELSGWAPPRDHRA